MIQAEALLPRLARLVNILFLLAGIVMLYAFLAGGLFKGDVRLQVFGLLVAALLVGCAWCILVASDAANFSLVATLIGCTLILAIWGGKSSASIDFSDAAYRHPHPYMMFTARPGAELPAIPAMSNRRDPTRIGALGVRVEDGRELQRRPGVTRIVMLGGSTVFNGTPVSHTIPGLLESRLGKRYRVFNFGVASYVSGQEFDLLAHRLLPNVPDIVITTVR